jgi:uncharacterized membrane protein HdeD (DUF308 family)
MITFANPAVTEVGLLLYIAAWSIATGAVEVVAAIRLRQEIEGEGWLILNGILSMAFGFILMLFPGAGALALIWLIATFAVIVGVVMVILSFRLRSLGPATATA